MISTNFAAFVLSIDSLMNSILIRESSSRHKGVPRKTTAMNAALPTSTDHVAGIWNTNLARIWKKTENASITMNIEFTNSTIFTIFFVIIQPLSGQCRHIIFQCPLDLSNPIQGATKSVSLFTDNYKLRILSINPGCQFSSLNSAITGAAISLNSSLAGSTISIPASLRRSM